MRLGTRREPNAIDVTNGLLRRAPHVLATAQRDEVVLFDTARERYYTLNDVGTLVWTLLGEPTTVASIVEAIRLEYAVPPDAAPDPVAGDVAALLRELHAAGMLVVDRLPGGAS
jgi:hypothetical protein